jgi:tungstate transport system ATP-binding protein
MRAPVTALPLLAEGLGYAAGGVEILRDVSLRIEAGPPLLVIGPNGAGKSVLLRLLHGLLAPTAGRLRWAGVAGPGARAERVDWKGAGPKRDAMVFQRPVMLRRSVLANLEYPLALAGLPRAARRARALAALAEAGLAALAGRPARRLSGGEQQRLALARAASLAPEVLFLDEPCASLDPAAAQAVEAAIAGIAARGCKIVMTTHDLAQARRLAGEVAFLHRGRLLEFAPAAEFFAGPRAPQAAAFLRGELLGGGFPGGELPA